MEITIIQFRVFLLFDKNKEENPIIEQAKELPNIDLYIFDDMLTALAHIHLNPDLLVFDIDIFDTIFLVEQVKENSPVTKIILIGSPIEIRKGIEFIKMGAADFFEKPHLDSNLILREVNSFYQMQLLDNSQEGKNSSLIEKYRAFGFIGNSRSMRRLYRMMDNASRINSHICISGESGSGKELVARTIQKLSKIKEGPILLFDVYSTPKELLEITLFGQEKNVFAGILKRQIGIIEYASGGTLIIDNIDAISLILQTRLQRALQEKKFIRSGGQNIVFLNARIIAMSQTNLLAQVNKNIFRKDLYYLLSNILIEVPPLRKRGQDILALASHILRDFIRKNKLKSLIFTQSAKDTLLNHPFPGNIRELKAIIESSAMMVSPPEISKEDLIFHEEPTVSDWLGEDLTLQEFTNNIILYYLAKYDNNVLLVADKLKIGKSTIYRLLKTTNTHK